MAEIPTFQEMQDSGLVAQPNDPSAVQYRNRKGGGMATGPGITHRRTSLTLAFRSSELTFPTGAGGLPTLRLAVVYEAPVQVENGTPSV